MQHIRGATRDDLPALHALDRSVFGEMPYPPFFFRQALDLWPEWLIVAAHGPALRGYALGAAAARSGEAWLLSMAVTERARGSGVGRALLQQLISAFHDAERSTIWLTVHPDNPAKRLYEATSFREVAREASYFHAGDPRLLMRLEL